MGKSKNLLDVIIVNYKSTEYLINCLRSIFDSANSTPIRVFVQDNNSKDGIDLLSTKFKRVHIKENSYNLGFAKAVNRAFEQCTAPYLLILNPDTIVFGGFFESVLQYLDENPDIGILGPRILNEDGSIQGSARSFPTPLTGLFGRTTLLSRYFPNSRITRANILTTRSDGKTPMEVDWVSGACMVVRREAVADVGLMDERFFLYWEDADWCRRMSERGFKVVYFPKASICHYVGSSSQKRIFPSVFEFHKSSYRLFNKYAKGPIRLILPVAILGLSIRLLLVLIRHGINLLLDQGFRGTREQGRGFDGRNTFSGVYLLEKNKSLERRSGKDRRKLEEGPKVMEMRSGKDRRNTSDRRSVLGGNVAFDIEEGVEGLCRKSL